MDKFCVITNLDKDKNLETTTKIIEYIKQNNKECLFLDRKHSKESDRFFTDADMIPDDTECAIVLGGDGTIIQAAHDLAEKGIPILGINLGTLGFLAEIERHSLCEALEMLFKDQCSIEERMMLKGTVMSNDVQVYSGYALNDVVITRSGFSRIISFSVYVNNEFVDRYRGDGVIISTPTGSTGYNLSSGGPIVKPDSEVMVITPISPHSLNSRSLVVSSKDRIKIKIHESKKTQEEEAIATLDGRMGILLQTEDEIEVYKASEVSKLIKINQASFFEILRTKIGQGGDQL